ncbi:MAG: carbamoyl phosphate synthase small subunit [Clostridia bacterium]|nr:carbamoyl phosphate synthase small subunit [Clostridia bacterium]
MSLKQAYLVLEDGTVFEGESFGAEGETIGEVVFTTGMVGYQEELTDPAFSGMIVMRTYPLTGNYGVNSEDNESDKTSVRGLIIKEAALCPNNFRSEGTIEDYLVKNNIIAITGIDTRALTRKLRDEGAMNGMITTDSNFDFEKRKDEIKAYEISADMKEYSTKEIDTKGNGTYKVAVLDIGTKHSLIENLIAHDMTVTVYPADASAEEILKRSPDGIVISDGTGNPKDYEGILDTVKELLTSKLPMMGVGMGHLLMAKASGASLLKMKFGHRGANQPVKDLASGRTYITTQNHGYVVDKDSVPTDVMEISHININDESVEGLRFLNQKAYTMAFSPDAARGVHTTEYMVSRLTEMMGGNK